MKIEVWREYEGPRAPKKIECGIYTETDKRIYGLARYLIDNGNAHEYHEPEQVEIKDVTETEQLKAQPTRRARKGK